MLRGDVADLFKVFLVLCKEIPQAFNAQLSSLCRRYRVLGLNVVRRSALANTTKAVMPRANEGEVERRRGLTRDEREEKEKGFLNKANFIVSCQKGWRVSRKGHGDTAWCMAGCLPHTACKNVHAGQKETALLALNSAYVLVNVPFYYSNCWSKNQDEVCLLSKNPDRPRQIFLATKP